MFLITVLTPTYNRVHLLPRLYNSLLIQTNKNFEWFVIDDGSSDDTEQVVKSWINENKISIKYLKKENGGKYSTLNIGVKEIKTILVFICDSDDYLTYDAIETIIFYHEKYKNYSEPICGYTFHRADENGTISGGNFPETEAVEHYHEYQINRWNGYFGGETAQCFFTEILQKFVPKRNISGQRKRITDDIIWIPIGFEYKTVYIDKVLQVYEYQSDGYTRNARKHQNYHVQYERGLLYMDPVFKFKHRLRGTLMANVYARFLRKKQKFNFLGILMYLPGLVVHKTWKWKYGMECE